MFSLLIVLLQSASELSLDAMVGGWTTQPTDGPSVAGFVQQGVAYMTQSSVGVLGTTGTWNLQQVLSVQRQVVAGMNYKIIAVFTTSMSNSTETTEFIIYVPLGATTGSVTSATALMM